MKKISLSLLAAGALLVTSCSNEDPAMNVAGNDGLVTFNVSVPGSINSRSISDGTTVEDLHYVIFDQSGNVLEEFVKPGAFAGDALRTQVQIQLVNGKKYKLAFWAQHPDAPYNFADGKVTVDYTDGKKAANDEVRDAFYGTYGIFECTSTFQPEGDIILTRPFAQVNVGTADWNTAINHEAAPTQTGMSFTASVASSLNLMDGTVNDRVEVDFDLAALPDNDNDPATVDDLTISLSDGTTATYKWIAMNYILVPADKETVNTVTFKHDFQNGEVSFNQVPVQRNYRTNIVGNILTSTTDWQIVIDPIFETPDYNVEYWDGSVSAPAVDATGNVSISSAAEFAGFAQLVNAGNTFAGKTVTLEGDVDLSDQSWTPIQKFAGTFDGNNCTISNLNVTGNGTYVGLFEKLDWNSTVQNLTIENAKVSGYMAAGALAGSGWTGNISNVTVTGLVQIEVATGYAGVISGHNTYGDLSNIVVDVLPGSYVKSTSQMYRSYVGGIAGFVGEGVKTWSNLKSNIDVIGGVCDAGGIVGIAHYGLTLENVECSGNVSLTCGSADGEYLEIGGIAGTWMNSDNAPVKLNNCSFTGSLSCTLADGTDKTGEVSGNTLVGAKYYSSSSAGALYIDNVLQ